MNHKLYKSFILQYSEQFDQVDVMKHDVEIATLDGEGWTGEHETLDVDTKREAESFWLTRD